jgi:gliding motility-associated-like protein
VPIVNLGGFISFCQGNSITLSAQNNSSTYFWSTGATTPSITVSTSGVYWVSVTNVCGTTKDTVVVQVDVPIVPNLGPDRGICSSGDSLVAPYIRGATYNWSGGGTANGNVLYINQAGTYSVSVSNACGTYSDQITVWRVNPKPLDLGPDIFACTNQPQTLRAGRGYANYRWYKKGGTGNIVVGPADSVLSVSRAGVYYVEVTYACGTLVDSIDVWYSQGSQLNLGGQVVLCGGASGTLTANANRGSYLWSTGATSKSITVSNSGTYWVRFTDLCGTFYDTVSVISGGPAVVNLGPDRSICASKGYVLNAGNPGSSYLWNTGATSQTLNVTQSGNYWVAVNNGCGSVYDSITINATPSPDPVIPDTVFICRGGNIVLDAGTWGPGTGYLWSSGVTARTATFLDSGYHWLQVWNQCDTLDKTFLLLIADPVQPDLGRDTVVCGSGYLINLELQGIKTENNTFLWSNGSTRPTTLINGTGIYWVKVSNACGDFVDTVKVYFPPKPSGFPQNSVSLCSTPGSLWLSVTQDSSMTYLWNTGSDSNAIFVTNPGTYWVHVYNLCDTISDTIDVVQANVLYPDLGNDTVLCAPGIVYYDMSSLGADSVRWSTGSRNAGLPVSVSGLYWVQLYNACGVFSDTVRVTINSPPVKRLNNAAICAGGTHTFNATQQSAIPTTTYQWSNGATTPSITVSQQGTYTVTMTNECGTTVDHAYLQVDQVIPQLNLGRDTIFCAGTLLLDAGVPGNAQYVWQNGSTDSTFLVSRSGKYYVQVSNACNTVHDTINVLITGPPKLILGAETRFCFGTTFTLNAQNPGCTYLWNTGATSQTITIDSAGVYWVTITNNCGQLTDSVNVIVEYPLNGLDLGPDTVICLGETLRLRTQYPDVAHLWTGGSTDTVFDVVTTGIYWCRVTNTCSSYIDSIYVEVQGEPRFSLGPDTVICADGGSVLLQGPPGMESYSWNGGAGPNTRNYLITSSGTYYLTVANKCFSYTDTIYVEEEYPIEIDLGKDTAICNTTSLMLDAGVSRYTVRWNDGTVGRYKPILKSGLYIARARNSCGTFYDSIYVDVQPFLTPPSFDTVICLEDSAVINLSNLRYDFEWFDGSKATVRTFFKADTFPLFITNKCGTFQKDFVVEKVNCECPFYIPNAFTPNRDGKNERFVIQHDCPLTSFHIRIFSRWGELVFESRDITQSWDGYFNNKLMAQDVYTYQIEYHYEVYGGDQVRYESGTLSILK